eukprot:701719-Alexandrium_andersonii.AAC.1
MLPHTIPGRSWSQHAQRGRTTRSAARNLQNWEPRFSKASAGAAVLRAAPPAPRSASWRVL